MGSGGSGANAHGACWRAEFGVCGNELVDHHVRCRTVAPATDRDGWVSWVHDVDSSAQPGAADVLGRRCRGRRLLNVGRGRRACGSEVGPDSIDLSLKPIGVALERGLDGDVRQGGGVHVLDVAQNGV